MHATKRSRIDDDDDEDQEFDASEDNDDEENDMSEENGSGDNNSDGDDNDDQAPKRKRSRKPDDQDAQDSEEEWLQALQTGSLNERGQLGRQDGVILGSSTRGTARLLKEDEASASEETTSTSTDPLVRGIALCVAADLLSTCVPLMLLVGCVM